MSAASDERLSPEVRAAAIVVVVGAMMSILDTTIVNVALESLSRDLDAPLSTIQWVATGYLLSLARSSRSPGGRPSASARGGCG